MRRLTPKVVTVLSGATAASGRRTTVAASFLSRCAQSTPLSLVARAYCTPNVSSPQQAASSSSSSSQAAAAAAGDSSPLPPEWLPSVDPTTGGACLKHAMTGEIKPANWRPTPEEVQAALKEKAAFERKAQDTATSANLSMKQKIFAYGQTGFFLYGFIHFGCLFAVWIAILFGVDLKPVVEWFGLNINPQGKTASFMLAIAVNKCFSPLHAALTLYLCPKVVPGVNRYLAARAARYGIKH